MSKNNKKSPKDVAFEKERNKYKKQIRELELTLKRKEEIVEKLQKIIDEKDENIRQQKDWIERLLQYTKLSEEDVKRAIEGQKKMGELAYCISEIFSINSTYLEDLSR